MAILQAAGESKGSELLKKCKELAKPDWKHRDNDVLLPYNHWSKIALEMYTLHNDNTYSVDLSKIRKHVDRVFELYEQTRDENRDKKDYEARTNKAGNSGHRQVDVMFNVAQKFAETIESVKFIRRAEVEKIKASYAYVVNPRFAFTVAFQTLCTVKAEASGSIAPTIRIFDESRTSSQSYLRAFKRAQEKQAGATMF